MLRNGVNYYGLYGNLRTCFEVESKGHELNKNCLHCLLDILPGFVRHILAISVRFQWVFRFAENFPLSTRYATIDIYPQNRGQLGSNIVFFEINCNVNNAVIIKHQSQTKNCGPRGGHKVRIRVGGLWTTDYGLTARPTVYIGCRACIYLCRMQDRNKAKITMGAE